MFSKSDLFMSNAKVMGSDPALFNSGKKRKEVKEKKPSPHSEVRKLERSFEQIMEGFKDTCKCLLIHV